MNTQHPGDIKRIEQIPLLVTRSAENRTSHGFGRSAKMGFPGTLRDMGQRERGADKSGINTHHMNTGAGHFLP